MGKEKELQKIKNNPKSVTPERLEALCKKYGFMWRQGTNHSITSHALLKEEIGRAHV